MIKLNAVSFNSTIVQCQGNMVSDMDGEKVMLSIKNGKYYNLGEVGGAIWDLVEKPIQVSNIISYLISHYNVEENMCKEHVISFIEHLGNEDLVSIS